MLTTNCSSSSSLTKTNQFHQANEIQPLLWTLVALISHSSHPKMGHLKMLLFKLIEIINSDAGLTLRAFHIKVSYVNIIQVSVVRSSQMGGWRLEAAKCQPD